VTDRLSTLVTPTLVTGATGFIGSAVARTLLTRGHRLRLLVRPGSDRRNLAGLEAELVEGDMERPEGFAAALSGCRALFHIAADYRLWVPDPPAMLRTNVAGTRALLRAARDAGVERVVYCSSVAALGVTGTDAPADETTPVSEASVIGVYKRSKYLAEQAVLALVREEGVPAVIVNPAAPIGPRDIKPTPTGRTIADAAAGRIPAFVDTGLNIVHVDDVAEGHALALERGRIGERYILGGENLSLAALLALVAEAAGRRPPTIRLPHGLIWPLAVAAEGFARLTGKPPMVTRDMLAMARKKMFFSSAKAQRELGYAPRPARLAVEDAVAWFRAA
jgi:dihydroflavonol-4-reductase